MFTMEFNNARGMIGAIYQPIYERNHMDLISVVNIIVEKNDKKFTFSMPIGANWGETYDACFECLQKIVELSKQAADNMKQQPVNGDDNRGE